MKAMKTITGVLLKVLDVLSIVLMVGMVVFLLIQLVARPCLPTVFPGRKSPPRSV